MIEDSNWFDKVDHNKITFKHLVYNYIQDNKKIDLQIPERAQKLKISLVSSGSQSSGSNTSVKEQAITKKMILADLMVEESYMKQKKL